MGKGEHACYPQSFQKPSFLNIVRLLFSEGINANAPNNMPNVGLVNFEELRLIAFTFVQFYCFFRSTKERKKLF